MKKAAVIMAVFVLLVLLISPVSASSLDSLKATLQLGPFQIKELGGFIIRQTVTTIETLSTNYTIQSIDRPGKTDADTISALAQLIVKSGLTAETYQNSNGLHGLFYIQEIGGSKLLTLMFVHGKDCLISVSSQSPDIALSSHYVQYLMDDYSLISGVQ